MTSTEWLIFGYPKLKKKRNQQTVNLQENPTNYGSKARVTIWVRALKKLNILLK